MVESSHIDIAVIGAGVVGLAVAARLAQPGLELFVFEQHPTFGRETSDRNSEVIHAGLYYSANSLKGRLCIAGRKQLYQLDPQTVFFKKTGKLIIATSEEELPRLWQVKEQASANGVHLQEMTKAEIEGREPEIEAIAALYSPETGIINAHQLMQYFLNQAAEAGGIEPVIYNTAVTGVEKISDGYRLITTSQSGEVEEVGARVVINAAGLGAERIAALAGIDTVAAGYKLHYCKGEYFRISARHKGRLKHLVYPVPEPAGLGVHATLEANGELKLGPSIEYLAENNIDYNVNPEHRNDFYRAAKKFLPWLQPDDLQPDQAGIRPKLFGSGQPERDFIIRDESDKGLPGFINLIGIESPGLTAAPAIGEYVAKLLNE